MRLTLEGGQVRAINDSRDKSRVAVMGRPEKQLERILWIQTFRLTLGWTVIKLRIHDEDKKCENFEQTL